MRIPSSTEFTRVLRSCKNSLARSGTFWTKMGIIFRLSGHLPIEVGYERRLAASSKSCFVTKNSEAHVVYTSLRSSRKQEIFGRTSPKKKSIRGPRQPSIANKEPKRTSSCSTPYTQAVPVGNLPNGKG